MKSIFVTLLLASIAAATSVPRDGDLTARQTSDTRFACSVDSDCVTMNRYSCCQYPYLVCAKAGSIFRPEDACGAIHNPLCHSWPILECGCINGRCVSEHSFGGGARGATPEQAIRGAKEDAVVTAQSEGFRTDKCATTAVDGPFRRESKDLGVYYTAGVDITCTRIYITGWIYAYP